MTAALLCDHRCISLHISPFNTERHNFLSKLEFSKIDAHFFRNEDFSEFFNFLPTQMSLKITFFGIYDKIRCMLVIASFLRCMLRVSCT